MSKDEVCCRICYDGPQEEDTGVDARLVSPCSCSGSSSYIHIGCLKKVFLSRRTTNDRLHCPTCKQKYNSVSSLMLATYDLTRLRSEQRAFDVDRIQEMAEAYSTMGKVLCDMGLYQTASDFYDLDLTMKQATYGVGHPAVGMSLNNKGILLCRQHKYSESEQCLKQANQIFEQVFGKDSPQVASVLGNLSLLYRDTDKCEKAIQLLDRCLGILESSHRNDNKDNTYELSLNIARMNRSLLLVRLQRIDEAEQQATSCLQYGRRAFSKTSRELIKWEGIAEMISKKKGEANILKPFVENLSEPVGAPQKTRAGERPSRPWSPVVHLVEESRPAKRLKTHEMRQ